MKFKNTNSDVTAALAPFGLQNFLLLALQDVPGSNEQRGIWAISTKDRNAFITGLLKLFDEHEELSRLFMGVFCANALQKKLAEAEVSIKSQKEGQT